MEQIKIDDSLFSGLNSSQFIDRVWSVLSEFNPQITLPYGVYVAKCNANGHLAVLKSLGLYKTTGKDENRRTFVNQTVKFIIDTTFSSPETVALSIISAVKKPLVEKPILIDFVDYDALKVSSIRRSVNSYGTYLIHNPINNLTKIGRTKSLSKRLAGLKRAHTDRLVVVGYCEKDVEKILHVQCMGSRVHGEWFALSQDAVLDIFNQYKFKAIKDCKI